MAATATDIILDTPAPDFRLPATDGRTYALADVAGEKGTVIVFICNHCPYVKAVIDRLVADARVLMAEGIGFAVICANDATNYPEDCFANMKRFATAHNFPFPYLHDETQSVARAYGAVCTPDYFGYDKAGQLKYRGRLDEGRSRLRRMRGGSLSRPCGPSRPQALRPKIKSRRLAAPSNGRRRDLVADQTPYAAARNGEIKEDKAI
jgi:peroxiredoxin